MGVFIMKTKACPICGSPMKRNGYTKAGKQRWRCKDCGSSTIQKIDTSNRELKVFLDWLLSKNTQSQMPGAGRSFRRLAARYWAIWPIPPVVDEIHRVVFADGIYLAKNVVILIARSEDYVLGWYLARAETSRAWEALLSRIAPPDMVVTDGGSGFAKAVGKVWPDTKVQRCLFHIYCQVKRCTTLNPNLEAGKELLSLSRRLMHVKTLKEAELWTNEYFEWADFWNDFLNESHWRDGRKEYEHERLRKARRSIVQILNKGTMFTYLDPSLTAEGPMPRTNNHIEGGVNTQLRDMLRNHRGMSTMKRIKAVYWWCYMHTECPLSAAEILKEMPTDKDIDLLYELYATNPKELEGPPLWGDGLVWEELHHSTRYPYFID